MSRWSPQMALAAPAYLEAVIRLLGPLSWRPYELPYSSQRG